MGHYHGQHGTQVTLEGHPRPSSPARGQTRMEDHNRLPERTSKGEDGPSGFDQALLQLDALLAPKRQNFATIPAVLEAPSASIAATSPPLPPSSDYCMLPPAKKIRASPMEAMPVMKG